jgi:hypothetical protein
LCSSAVYRYSSILIEAHEHVKDVADSREHSGGTIVCPRKGKVEMIRVRKIIKLPTAHSENKINSMGRASE